MHEPNLLQIGTSGLRGKGMKRSTFRFRRSKVNVTRRRS